MKRTNSTPAERQAAAEMRARGLTPRQIAYRLGRHHTTIQRWLSPKPMRNNREATRRWRKRNPRSPRDARRAYKRRVARGVFGHCKRCNNPLRGELRTDRGLCARCIDEDREWFWREIEQRWGDGETTAEIAEAMQREVPQITAAIHRMRKNGYDLPYRRRDSRSSGSPQSAKSPLDTFAEAAGALATGPRRHR